MAEGETKSPGPKKCGPYISSVTSQSVNLMIRGVVLFFYWCISCISVKFASDSEKRDALSTGCDCKHLFFGMVGTTVLWHSFSCDWVIIPLH